MLIKNGADINKRDIYGKRPYDYVVENRCDIKLMEMLK